MVKLRIRGLHKTYGTSVAVGPIDLDIAAEEFVTLLGPSGCGKSSLLRMICGITPAGGGSIELDGHRIDHLPPERRDVAMVFQSYALFPHMNVRKNLTFGLRMKGVPADEQEHRVAHAAEICNLSGLLDRMPRQLSGGQQQRVALARAIVMQPALLLFDEPLSNLDAQLRDQLREELVRLHRRLGTTSLYVTHDQAEAMSMADRIVVMHAGRIVETGTPHALYRSPRSAYTARFLGHGNCFELDIVNGQVHLPWGQQMPVECAPADDGTAVVLLRAEEILLSPASDGPGRILGVNFAGARVHYVVAVNGHEVRVTENCGTQLLQEGQMVALRATASPRALERAAL